MQSPSPARAVQSTATHSSTHEAVDATHYKSVATRSKLPSSGRVIATAGSTIASPTLRSRSAPEGPSFRLSSQCTSVNDTLRVLSSGADVRVSDEELMALIPRLRRADAPTTKLLASPFEDLFILRAAVGDFEDIIRRLARGQNVNALHSVSAVHNSCLQTGLAAGLPPTRYSYFCVVFQF